MKEKLYIVQYLSKSNKWKNAYWTKPDAYKPKPVSLEEAVKAISLAYSSYPDVAYRLKEVKQ